MSIQKQEVEVLESIYLEDFSYIQAKFPFKFTINCRPFLDHPYSEDDTHDLKLVFELSEVLSHLEIPARRLRLPHRAQWENQPRTIIGSL